MLADTETVNRVLGLTWRLHELTGRRCAEVFRALLATRALRSLGHDGADGRLTQEQAVACVRLLDRWTRQAKERKI